MAGVLFDVGQSRRRQARAENCPYVRLATLLGDHLKTGNKDQLKTGHPRWTGGQTAVTQDGLN